MKPQHYLFRGNSIFLVILFFAQSTFAQQSSIDSVLRLMHRSDDGRLTMERYFYLAGKYHELKNDSMGKLYLGKAVDVAQRHDWKREEIMGKFFLIDESNQATALTQAVECLRIAESLNDTVGIINFAFRINLIYSDADEYLKALEYSRMILDVSSAARDSVWQWNGLYAVASAYINLGKADSGLLYAQEAYRHAVALTNFTQRWVFDEKYQYPSDELLAWSLHVLGRAQHLLKDDQLAINYFSKALSITRSSSQRSPVSSVYSSLAQSFLSLSQMDSVINYCRLYLSIDTLVPNVIPIYIYLAQAYERKNSDSAVAFYRAATARRENYFNAKSRSVVIDIMQQEENRRKDLLAAAAEQKRSRNRNLQLSFLGIGLISFCILYLLISQTIIVKSGLVKFLGILALLLVFEFINLFLHPVIENFTHHSPIWMFLIMVSIAALLIPAHHKLEKWITTLLVEKNKRIRLDAARKTIKSLEG